jgi:hypothetical protein
LLSVRADEKMGTNPMNELSLPTPRLSTALVLGLAAILLPSACGESDEGDGNAGRGGESGSGGKGGSSGKGGSAGKAGTSGNGGSAGKGSGGQGGKGGSSGKGGSGGEAGGGAAGEAGQAAEAGHGGQEVGGAAGVGGSGDAGQGGDGSSPMIAGATCKAILEDMPSAMTGLYLLDPDGEDGEEPVVSVCDMETDGGGWTLALLKNSVGNGNYATFASGRFNVASLAVTPELAAANTSGTPDYAGWIDLNQFPYADLVLAGYRNGTRVYRSEPIPKSELRIPFGQDGYYLYDQVDGYYWCGGTTAYTVNGVGQVDPPSGAPADCKGHTSLGDGWDFGTAASNQGLTVCGGGSALMTVGDGSGLIGYGAPGAAQAFWVR